MAIMKYPAKAVLGDISVRDGLQHEQKTIPLQAKLWLTEQFVLAGFTALQAGITHFESTLGGTGGQPANLVDGCPVAGTGKYYYADPNIVGLTSTENMVVMMDEMEIETGA